MKLRDMQGWQRKRLLSSFLLLVVIGVVFLSYTSITLYQDKTAEDEYWKSTFNESVDREAEILETYPNATPVTVGTYVENLKEISLKSSNFRVVVQIWFKWEGDPTLDMGKNFRFYKGAVNKSETIKDYHENGTNYQLLRCDVTISNEYWTPRFPLESHQLRMYLESNYTADRVRFVSDRENSGCNPNLDISGYTLRRNDTGIFVMAYDNTHGDPELSEPAVTFEHITAMEINRDSWGLYVKCFIALFGTSTWVLITLFICTYHRVDPLGMIPAALFGTVSNIMIGANLLPDALQLGLLEYVNFWGICTILACALAVININRIRSKFQDRDFARYYGRVLFVTILVLTVLGHILMPVSAYMF